jgi:hypothetical protein
MTSKLPDAEALRGARRAAEGRRHAPATAMIGLHTGGAWVAERLHPLLGLKGSAGSHGHRFHRDDYAKEGLKHDPKKTRIPFEVEGRDLLLVDDVALTRTHRARRDERAVRLRPAAQHRAGGACRPRRPPAADRRAALWRAHRGARRQEVAPKARCQRQAVAGAGRCHNPQLNANGELQHLLSIEGLPRESCCRSWIPPESFAGVTEREVKKVPLLRGKSVFNLFFEASTRTRTTFEIAAKRLSADVINLNVAVSLQSR